MKHNIEGFCSRYPMNRILWKLVASSLVVAMLGAAKSTTFGQTASWSEPVMLSQTGVSGGWFPDIAVDLAGRLHVAWASGVIVNRQLNFDVVMYAYSDDGAAWSEPNDIFSIRNNPGESAATRPALAVDGMNVLHITYTDYLDIYYSRALAENAYSTSAWEESRRLTTDGAYFSRVTSHQTRLDLVDTAGSRTGYVVNYRRSYDFGDTWSAPSTVSNRSTGAAKPQLLIDHQNNLHAVWESGPGGALGQVAGGSIAYAASYDQGATWQAPVEFTSPLTPTTGRFLKSPAIGLDQQGRLVMVWLLMPDDVVYYTLSEDRGRTWGNPEPITGVEGGNHFSVSVLGTYAMITDGAGRLHLLMSGRLAADPPDVGRLLHLVWDGQAWSTPETIARYVTDTPNWPRVAIRNGDELHVVWHVSRLARQQLTGRESPELEIWYSRRRIDAPRIVSTILPRPTIEATIASTPSPAAGASPTVVPTDRPVLVSPGDPISVYRETDYLMLIGLSLLPVVGLILLIVLGGRLARRH